MWSIYAWESKVNVVTEIRSLAEYSKSIISKSNMKCISPEGDDLFMTVNLYAKSRFGEDAMANISIEMTHEGKITGSIRIRAKNQGMANCLAEKFDQIQKEN
jgi:coatomer subunit beta